MYRENNIESSVKWFLFIAAGLAGFCQIILLFSEFRIHSGITMFVNAIYHIVSVACPIIIGYLVYKRNEDMKIYSGYLLGIQGILSLLTDLCITGVYAINMKELNEPKVWIIVLGLVTVVIEIFAIIVFVFYGQEKMTCILAMLVVLVLCIIRGAFYSSFDSSMGPWINKMANTRSTVSLFSVWTFMHLFTMFGLMICISIYMDHDFLEDVIKNPKTLFSSKNLISKNNNTQVQVNSGILPQQGFNYGAYMAPNTMSGNQMIQVGQGNQQMSVHNTDYLTAVQPVIGICPDCGKEIHQNQKMCYGCGFPAELLNNNTSANTTHEKVTTTVYRCPDCGTDVGNDLNRCPNCGCPKEAFIVM